MVWGNPFMDVGLVHPVAQHVVDRSMGLVDRDLGKVWPAQTRQLCIDVGKKTALQ